MHTSQRISIIVGAGVTILSLVIGVAASVWPEYIKPHPYWLGTLGAVGLILIVIPSFVWFLSREDPSNQEFAAKSNSVGRDNYGKQINADIVLYHEALAAPKQPEPPIVPLPVLEFEHSTRGVRYDEGRGLWTFDGTAARGILVQVRNPRPPVGELGRRLERVIAHLLFESEGTGERVEIDRAYWVGSSANAVPLDIAQGRTVLACTVTTKHLLLHKNPRSMQIHPTRLRRSQPFLLGSPSRLSISQPIRCTVSVLLAREFRTLAERSFRISLEGNQPNIEEV